MLPEWLDTERYPFTPRSFAMDDGRLCYVDEGEGRPILMVHGTPTWSFLWRHFIRGLSDSYRVIAPDLLGFGLSEKPEDADYRPEAQARRLHALIEHLGLENIVLMVHDFGGPIGLSYAVDRPTHVRALILFNTWMWPLDDDSTTRWASRLFGSRLGRFLYRRLNFSPRVLLKSVFGDASKLTPDLHRQYLAPFPDYASRKAPWIYARELIGSSDWYETLWQRRNRLTDTPTLLLWGLRDPAFDESALTRWQRALPHATTQTFPHCGHFVQEETPEQALTAIRTFLDTVDADAQREGT